VAGAAKAGMVVDFLDGHLLSGSQRDDLADIADVAEVGGVSPCDAFAERVGDDVGVLPNRCAWLARLLVVLANGRSSLEPVWPHD
jgi:hypothetical protein